MRKVPSPDKPDPVYTYGFSIVYLPAVRDQPDRYLVHVTRWSTRTGEAVKSVATIRLDAPEHTNPEETPLDLDTWVLAGIRRACVALDERFYSKLASGAYAPPIGPRRIGLVTGE